MIKVLLLNILILEIIVIIDDLLLRISVEICIFSSCISATFHLKILLSLKLRS